MEENEIYPLIGEKGFELLIGAFYRRIPEDDLLGPMYAGRDLQGAEQRLRDFLVFRFGGPSRYIEERGHPRLRMRHVSFSIGKPERDRWMRLMNAAFQEAMLPFEAEQVLRAFFESTSSLLINQLAP